MIGKHVRVHETRGGTISRNAIKRASLLSSLHKKLNVSDSARNRAPCWLAADYGHRDACGWLPALDRAYSQARNNPCLSVHAHARPPPEPRSGFRPRRRFLSYEFRLGANDGDVGGAGARYGVDVTTPRSPHPPPLLRYEQLGCILRRQGWTSDSIGELGVSRRKNPAVNRWHP